MSFLQPWLLLALPLVLIPIIIHLVNQWRYQTKPWAAMIFLLAAKSMHRGLARLRQWLILAMRVLAIGGLIIAVSRPLTSGIMGLVAGGRVDTTIIMLDRSPSMLQQASTTRESKLATGLRQLRQTLENQPSSRWILIDSAKPSSQDFPSLDAIIDAPIAGGTSATSSWPTMFQTALDYIQSNRPSQTNIWICSDMRQADWQADHGPWPALREAFQKLPSQVRFFAITYPELATTNRSLIVEQVRLERDAEKHDVVLTIRVHRDGSHELGETIPVQLAIGSGRSEISIDLVGGVGELKDVRIPIDSSVTLGWGKASIPADDNAADNQQYFAFDVTPTQQTMVIGEDPNVSYPLQIAAEISRNTQSSSNATFVPIDMADKVEFDKASLIIWQGPLPTGDLADRLMDYLDQGRSLWFMPSLSMTNKGSSIGSDTTFAGFRWLEWMQPATPLKTTTWRSDEGLLAATQSGMALPVGEILIKGYATFDGEATSLATIEGGASLLAKLNMQRGNAYVCTTLPIEQTSTMAKNGIALFIAIQRSIEQGGIALGNTLAYEAVPLIASKGEVDSAQDSATRHSSKMVSTNRFNLSPFESWQPIATDERFLSNEIGLHSGIYESGTKWVAVNRPLTEDDAASMSHDQFSQLLKGLDITAIEDSAGSTKSIRQEIWRIFLVVMIAALLIEALLSLPRRTSTAFGQA